MAETATTTLPAITTHTPVVTLAQVVCQLETLYPLRYAENWDHPGLIIGNPLQTIRHIYCAVDPSLDVVREAIKWGADLLITHHPLWFRPTHTISGTGHRGAVANLLIKNHCALWVGHTNADAAYRGVSEALADKLGVLDQKPIAPIDDPTSAHKVGEGRVGHLAEPMSLLQFAQRVNAVIPPTRRGIDVAGDLHMPVQRVAVLGGSGDSLFNEVRAANVDVYVTSDLRHHPVLDACQQAQREAELRAHGIDVSESLITGAKEAGYRVQGRTYARPAFINTPHYASEKVWFDDALQDIPAAIKQATGVDVDIALSPTDTDPWTLHLDSPTEPVMPQPDPLLG